MKKEGEREGERERGVITLKGGGTRGEEGKEGSTHRERGAITYLCDDGVDLVELRLVQRVARAVHPGRVR